MEGALRRAFQAVDDAVVKVNIEIKEICWTCGCDWVGARCGWIWGAGSCVKVGWVAWWRGVCGGRDMKGGG